MNWTYILTIICGTMIVSSFLIIRLGFKVKKEAIKKLEEQGDIAIIDNQTEALLKKGDRIILIGTGIIALSGLIFIFKLN